MVQFLSINFFSWISFFLLGFSKVPVFLCHLYIEKVTDICGYVLLVNKR